MPARESPLLAGVALSSFSALLLELALTRLFSVVLFYHFAFLAISVALLGLGAGGVFAHLWRRALSRWNLRTLGSGLCAVSAVSVVLVLEVVLHTRVPLQLSYRSFRGLTVLYLSCAVPFFLTGLLFSVAFARNPGRISRLYGADLTGGALACLAVVPLLDHLGGPNTVLLAATAMAVSSVVWAESQKSKWLAVALSALLAILVVANSVLAFIDVVYAKGERRQDKVAIEFTRWNAISRVEVDRQSDGARYVVIDADASTAIMNVDPRQGPDSQAQRWLMQAAPAVSNVLRPHGTFAIIGPGGGVDVLRAVVNGSPHVTGIEINPIIVDDVMRGRYAEYSYHLYDIPQVTIHNGDGRAFIRNSNDRYDVVQMTLVDTWASTAAGAFALSENNLYTVEAFREYFEHLKPDGMIAITRWEFSEPREALRVVSVAMDALHRIGVADAARNFAVVSDGPVDVGGRPVLVLAKRSAFTPEEQATIQEHIQRNPNLVAQYLPFQPGGSAFAQLIAANDPIAFARQYKFDVSPVHDSAPFFFFTLKLSQIWEKDMRAMDWRVNVGVLVLLIVLVLSLAAVMAFLLVPLALEKGGHGGKTLQLTYFVAIGLGYILVEIAFIQRFVLFLGHPTYALTVVVFLMLLSSGIGSMLSRRWLARPETRRIPLAIIMVVILAYVFLLPGILTSLVGLPFAAKLVISGVLLAPLGIAMGMPFPTGLHALSSRGSGGGGKHSIEWAWAMNAAASVLGSVLAMVIAIRFGLNVTLACGAVAYAVAMLTALPGFFRRAVRPLETVSA
jgi:hypothetical protein